MMFHLVFLTKGGNEVRDAYMPFDSLDYAVAFGELELNHSDFALSNGDESRISSFSIFDLNQGILYRSCDIGNAPDDLHTLGKNRSLSAVHHSEPGEISEENSRQLWNQARQLSAGIDRDVETVAKVLSQASGSYVDPVSRLLVIRDAAVGLDPSKWLNYKSDFGIGIEHETDLIRLATDRALRATSRKEHEAWGPVHATRALGQLRSSRSVPALLHALRDNIEGRPTPREIGYVFAAVGDLALEILSEFLVGLPDAEDVEIEVVLALKEVANFEPSMKQACIETVKAILRARITAPIGASIGNNAAVCSFAVAILVQMKAVSCYTEISEAYRLGLADCVFCGDIEDVEIKFGLRTERQSPRREFGPLPTAVAVAQMLGKQGIDLGPAFYHLNYSKPHGPF